MAKVSAKRQITLPNEQCNIAGINSGDDVEIFVDRQQVISVVKKTMGAAKGMLQGTPVDSDVSDDESLESVLNQ